MEKVESKDKIECMLCGEKFPIITPSHLKKRHSMSLSDYKEKFPEAPITSSQYKAKQKFLKGSLFSKEEEKATPIVDEINLGDLTLKTESKVDVELKDVEKKVLPKELEPSRQILDRDGRVVNQLKINEPSTKPKPPRPEIVIMPAKRTIIEFLQTVFPITSVINNFAIEKFYRDGILEYRYITDIAIPSKNIDLEFTKCFWHNNQLTDQYRNQKLERDGWIVIEIPDLAPTVDIVKSYLQHRKLI
jgi:hypothetical protein